MVIDYEASRQVSRKRKRLTTVPLASPMTRSLYKEHVKRGLRNADGSGVVAGSHRICDVHGYNTVDGKLFPDEGKLTLRGYLYRGPYQ